MRERKGGRERVVPIGERARWIDKYVGDARPELLVPPDASVLFLARLGEAFRPAPLTNLVRGYVNRAELGKTGSGHYGLRWRVRTPAVLRPYASALAVWIRPCAA